VKGPTGTYAHGHQTATADLSRYTSRDVSYWEISNQLQPSGAAAQSLVARTRELPPPSGEAVHVGGNAADLVDQKASISSELPVAGLIIALATFLILFLFTGSVLIPLKAVVLNALTLFAALGAMVWIFQDGHLSNLLGFTPTPTSTTIPTLLYVIAFGLSMDYEVFLISRMKELHDRGESTDQAIIGGLAMAGPIVSTAAGLLAVTFFAFGLAKISFIQFFGIGTGVAILVDATTIRGVLVPIVMHYTGDRIWWAPKPLRRLHDRIGLAENPAPKPHGSTPEPIRGLRPRAATAADTGSPTRG
jgi:RND superfamily putative drug exporter